MRRVRVPTLESLFVATFALLGFRLGALPIGDNSAFVHLRTGIDMARGKGIPRADPYSFTAAGEPWVVQSWLAELSYGMLHRLGGMGLVILQQGALMAALAWLIARLARAGTPMRTALAASAAIAIGVRYWSPRPLLFGLLGLAFLVTVVERRLSPWWLLPVAWLWVNSHGSFALGVAWLVLRVLGETIDARSWRAARHAVRYLAFFILGVGLGALNPLGPRLLTFVATVVERRSAFEDVVEWRSPVFASVAALVSLGGLLVAVGVLIYRRAGLLDALPVLGFVAAGLVAQRNLAAAAVVTAPALARALAVKPRAEPARHGVHLGFVAVLVVAAFVFGAGALRDGRLDTDRFPVAATQWLEAEGLRARGVRVAHQDFVGGWLILRDGRDARVFVDDRVDMYPAPVVRDYVKLLRGRPAARRVLDDWDVDVVLWARDGALSAILSADDGWKRAYADGDWWIFVRRPATAAV